MRNARVPRKWMYTPEYANSPQQNRNGTISLHTARLSKTMIQAGGVPPTKSWPLMATCQLQSYGISTWLLSVVCTCLLRESRCVFREFWALSNYNSTALRSTSTQREKGWKTHWVDLRENLQESWVFTLQNVRFSTRFSLKPSLERHGESNFAMEHINV